MVAVTEGEVVPALEANGQNIRINRMLIATLPFLMLPIRSDRLSITKRTASEDLSLARLGLRSAFRRPAWTALSIAGVALCLMLMLTVAGVSGRYVTVVKQGYEIYSSNVVVVSRASLLFEGLPLGGILPEALIQQVTAVPGVASATPILVVVDVNRLVPSNVTIGVPIANFSMFGKVSPIQLKGSYPTANDQIVVGSYLARTSNLTVGSTLDERGTTLEVVAIISTPNLVLSSSVIMPLSTAQATQGYAGFVSAILVTSSGPDPAVMAQRIDSEVPGVAVVDPMASGFLSNPVLSSISTVNESVQVISIVLAFLFISIISAVNVLDQKEHFWTMRAIGSSSRSIIAVSLSGAAIVCLAGAVAGSVLAVIATAVSFQVFALVPFLATVSDISSLVAPSSFLYACLAVVGFGTLVSTMATVGVLRELK